jgi:Flp pilus assembly protein TadG
MKNMQGADMQKKLSSVINFLSKKERVFLLQNRFLRNFHKKSCEFLYSNQGAIAVEFVYIAPFMLLFWFGMVVASEAVSANRKVVLLSYTIGDMISQSTQINQSDLDSIFEASASILWPFQSSMIALRVTSYKINSKGEAYINWSSVPTNSKLNGEFKILEKCKKISGLEKKLLVKSSELLFIETQVTYTSSIGATIASSFYSNTFMDSTVPIISNVYTKPRQTIKTNTLETLCMNDPYKE